MPRNVVIRSNLSGVHFGTLVKREGNMVTLRNARRAWDWEGGLSCSELAVNGPAPSSKLCVKVSRMMIFDVIEIIDATDAAGVKWLA